MNGRPCLDLRAWLGGELKLQRAEGKEGLGLAGSRTGRVFLPQVLAAAGLIYPFVSRSNDVSQRRSFPVDAEFDEYFEDFRLFVTKLIWI